ncbi:MAG: hypothetical protein OXU45_04045, partial [Candidatus Melainabacteria bacterium]|nr:hypothetical protein [Candidatus Melainabacteria bacterium]
NKLFRQKLEKLQQKNKSGGFNMDEIVDSIKAGSRFDFSNQLDAYFRAGLLSAGRLIDLQQYQVFDNRAKSLRGANIV